LIFVIITGYVKVLLVRRQAKKHGIEDEEQSGQTQEVERTNAMVEIEADNEVLFGVRALESGIEIDGIWNTSGTATPMPHSVKVVRVNDSVSGTEASLSDDRVQIDANEHGQGGSFSPTETILPVSRPRITIYRSSTQDGSSIPGNPDAVKTTVISPESAKADREAWMLQRHSKNASMCNHGHGSAYKPKLTSQLGFSSHRESSCHKETLFRLEGETTDMFTPDGQQSNRYRSRPPYTYIWAGPSTSPTAEEIKRSAECFAGSKSISKVESPKICNTYLQRPSSLIGHPANFTIETNQGSSEYRSDYGNVVDADLFMMRSHYQSLSFPPFEEPSNISDSKGKGRANDNLSLKSQTVVFPQVPFTIANDHLVNGTKLGQLGQCRISTSNNVTLEDSMSGKSSSSEPKQVNIRKEHADVNSYAASAAPSSQLNNNRYSFPKAAPSKVVHDPFATPDTSPLQAAVNFEMSTRSSTQDSNASKELRWPLLPENMPETPQYPCVPVQPRFHANKSVRKVNSGFEVLPAGTFGISAPQNEGVIVGAEFLTASEDSTKLEKQRIQRRGFHPRKLSTMLRGHFSRK
jgi:hypothetical protein